MAPPRLNDGRDPPSRPALADMDVGPNNRSDDNEQPGIGRGMQGRKCNTQVQPRPTCCPKSRDSQAQSVHVLDNQGCQNREDNGGLLRDGDKDNKDHRYDENPDGCDVVVASGWRRPKKSAMPVRISSRPATLKTSETLEASRSEENGRSGSNDAHGNTNTANDGPYGHSGQPPRKWRRRVAWMRQRGVDPSPSTASWQPSSEKATVMRKDSLVGVQTIEEGAVDVENGATMSTSSTALATGSSWSVRCTPALFVISVVSAGVFVCMSLQAFSVLRTHGLSDEWTVENRTSESTSGAQRAAAGSAAKAATPEDEGFQTASDADVE